MKSFFLDLPKRIHSILFSNFRNASKYVEAWKLKNQIPLTIYETIDSTNDQAKKEAFSNHDDVHVYFAKTQTMGRGRHGRTWVSCRPDSQFLATWSIRLPSAAQAITAPLIGLGLYQALVDTYPNENWSIKPPNDIFLDQQKVLGILVESLQKGDAHQLIVGVGLNIWDVPKDVPMAGSIGLCCDREPKSLVDLIERMHSEIVYAARSCLAPNLSDSQRARLLDAIQKCPVVELKPTQISPFGDLITPEETISWRNI